MQRSGENEIADSALDFILKSCDDFENQDLEQHGRLKYSTIHLCAGIELVLKAKLCQEHWTLVLADPDKYKEGNWEKGDFRSVSIEDAIHRIGTIIGADLPYEAAQAIHQLSRLRNRYVHFVVTDTPQFVAAIQLKAWHYALEMLNRKFLELTHEQEQHVENATARMLKHQSFIDTRFEALREDIEISKVDGTYIIECPFCDKPALKIGDAPTCFVCGNKRTSPETYAEAYHRKMHPYLNSKDYIGEEITVWCSDCDEKSCIPVPEELQELAIQTILEREKIQLEPGMDLEPYICLNCGTFFENADITECGACGAKYMDGRICPVCSE